VVLSSLAEMDWNHSSFSFDKRTCDVVFYRFSSSCLPDRLVLAGNLFWKERIKKMLVSATNEAVLQAKARHISKVIKQLNILNRVTYITQTQT